MADKPHDKKALEKLNQARYSGSPSCKLYNEWAPEYEADMVKVNYLGPTRLMAHFDKITVPKDAKILDVCAGTGGIGRELVKRGYTDLHAIDGAENMLALAKKEGNYKSYTHLLFEADTRLPYEDHTFDLAVMAGVFCPGHLPIVALREICRVMKVGGIVFIFHRDPEYYADKDPQYANHGFQKFVDKLRDDGTWKVHDGFPILVHPYTVESDGYVQAFVVTGPVKSN